MTLKQGQGHQIGRPKQDYNNDKFEEEEKLLEQCLNEIFKLHYHNLAMKSLQ